MNNRYRISVSFFIDNLLWYWIHYLFHLLYQLFLNFMLTETHLHVLPDCVEFLLSNWHMLVRFVHGTSFVVIWTPKHHWEVICHYVMQLSNIANIFQIVNINIIIIQYGLIELSHYFLNVAIPPQPVIKGWHELNR